MKKAPKPFWADFSEYSFMVCLNAIFQSQTLLKLLFYKDENWLKEEQKKEALRILIHMPLNVFMREKNTTLYEYIWLISI